MIEYYVVKVFDLDIMVRKVNEMLGDVFQLHGGVTMTQGVQFIAHAQALTRKIEMRLITND